MHGQHDHGHRGPTETGLTEALEDHRITDLQEEADHLSRRDYDNAADPFATETFERQHFGGEGEVRIGVVTHALPTANWYRVQIGSGGSFISCCKLGGTGGLMPTGVRESSLVPPNSTVLVWTPSNSNVGYILGPVPDGIKDEKVGFADWIQQGGQSGSKREKGHKQPFQLLREGGVQDYSAGRPADETHLDWTMIAETGVGVHVDPFQSWLRVNEACGVFFNYFDSHARLAGIQLDIQSYARQIESRDDEGENQWVDGNVIFPWESMGCYSSGTAFATPVGYQSVQYDEPYGALDIKGDEDLQPFYRAVDYGGYLGQGYQRFMCAPKKQGGKRKYPDDGDDVGVFHEHVAMDGSYMLRSAKQVMIAKRVLIPIPKRQKLREDRQSGDDGEKSNYKFSGKFGGGEAHKIKDIEVTGEEPHLLRVAGVLDILAFAYNWRGLHPFHYHKEDYEIKEESELDPFTRATDNLSFGELAGKEWMQEPSPVPARIDFRYGQVDYFQRESYLALTEDGSVVLADGYGSQITMAGGQIRLEAPGDIELLAGKRVVNMGWDCVTRAKNSVDVSASEKDVRLKAEKNFEILGGNDEQSGVLIQSKGSGRNHTYDGLYGEDVRSTGVVLLCKKGEVAALGKEIYLRTGGGELQDGRITIDASKGRKEVVMYGRKVHMFVSREVNIWHAPTGESANPTKSHRFSAKMSKIDGLLVVERDLCVTDGNLIVAKNVLAEKNIVAARSMMHSPGPFVGEHKGQISFQSIIDACEEIRELHVDLAEPIFESVVKQRWYEPPNVLGNEDLLRVIGFSYRDPPGSPRQYRTQQLKLVEPRWQQMVRTGMGSGGTGWTEKPVIYQGDELYPWPGKQKWKDEPTFYRYEQHEIFDEGQARSKDRPGPYETPKLSQWDKVVLDGEYKTII